MRLWGPQELLSGWRLLRGVENLGPGELVAELPSDTPPEESSGGMEIIEQVNFAGACEAQLEWPAFSLTSKVALSELLALDENGAPYVVKPRGWLELENAFMERKGYSCLRVRDRTLLYGAALVTYRRVRWYRRWLWTAPAQTYGAVWFFLYDAETPAPYKRFSISLPELAASAYETKNLAIRAVDSSTQGAIPNATVWIDDLQIGVTDAEGVVYANNVRVGERAFKATAAGYLDTGDDALSNETITV